MWRFFIGNFVRLAPAPDRGGHRQWTHSYLEPSYPKRGPASPNNRPCHTQGRLLTQIVPKSHRSPNPLPPARNWVRGGNRIEGLANFGKPTGEIGTVETSERR